jgi:hypothetical protein
MIDKLDSIWKEGILLGLFQGTISVVPIIEVIISRSYLNAVIALKFLDHLQPDF